MGTSKADRPYGTFAREPAPEPPPQPVHKARGIGAFVRTRRGKIEVGATIALVVLALAMLAGATLQKPYVPELAVPEPTPTPTIPELYEKVAKSVVHVAAGPKPNEGSGVVVDDLGDILTSLHVVKDQTNITVTFPDGTRVQARILQTIPESDIAALRPIQPPGEVVPATLGNPGSLRIGDDAIVIGDPFGLRASLSTGVISGLGRSIQPQGFAKPITGLIQFDASVNPGSSGGPLLNRDGDVVGIVTGLANPSGQPAFSGVGFAVTIQTAGGAIGVPPD